MRTITEILRNRLVAQADEAEACGLIKIANHLTDQIEKTEVRSSDSFYSYAEDDLKKDVESLLWDSLIRVADFHNHSLDAIDAQNIIEKASEDLIHDIRVKLGAVDGVGAYEPTLLGETKEHLTIELTEKEL